MQKNQLKNQILVMLREFPDTRNSDIKLMIHLWNRYYPAHIKNTSGGQGIFLSSLYTLPTQESIKRIRAVVQNDEHKYLPSDSKVRKQRRIKEEEWREWINQNNEYKRM